jgi:hypothetical protein
MRALEKRQLPRMRECLGPDGVMRAGAAHAVVLDNAWDGSEATGRWREHRETPRDTKDHRRALHCTDAERTGRQKSTSNSILAIDKIDKLNLTLWSVKIQVPNVTIQCGLWRFD